MSACDVIGVAAAGSCGRAERKILPPRPAVSGGGGYFWPTPRRSPCRRRPPRCYKPASDPVLAEGRRVLIDDHRSRMVRGCSVS